MGHADQQQVNTVKGLPSDICDVLAGKILGDMHPAWLDLDEQFRFIAGGGQLALYGLQGLSSGDDLHERLVYLEGMDIGSLLALGKLDMLQLENGIAHDVLFVSAQAPAALRLILADVRLMSEQRRAMQQKANELDLLNHQLQKMTQALEVARNEAEEANALRGAFIASMSHEFRTPIAAVLGHARVLQGNLQGQSGPLEHLKALERSANHLLSMIGNVLDEAQITAGKLVIEPVPTCLAELLADLYSIFQPLAAEKGLSLDFQLGQGIPDQVDVDPVRVRQIFINLLGNALKFTEKGKVRFQADWRDGQLSVELEDTGPGIAEQDQAKIFQAFGQSGSVSNRRAGTGLGLSISLGLLRQMQGGIELQSQLGKGSCFRLQLQAPQTQIQARNPAQGSSPLAAKRVLLVEDDPDIRGLLQLFLKEGGYAVMTAEDGEEGLNLAMNETPDLVLTDLQLPILNGHELIARLRQEGFQGAVVGMSAATGSDERDKVLEAGADGFLPKPVDPGRLASRLGEIFDART